MFPDVGAGEVVQIRMMFTSFVLFLLIAVTNPKALRVGARDILYFIVFGVGGVFVMQYFITAALRLINVGLTTFTNTSSTLMIFLYSAVVLKEKMSAQKIAGLVIGFLGLVFIFLTPEVFQVENLLGIGLLLAVVSAIGKTFFVLYGKSGSQKYDRRVMMMFGLFFASLAALFVSDSGPVIANYYRNIWAWGFFFGHAGILMSIAFVFYFRGVAVLPASNVAILNIIEPTIATLAAFIMLGERMTVVQSIGCVLVGAAVVVLNFHRKKKETNTV